MTWNELTLREKQVIALAAHGLSQRRIARVLGISHRTVEEHLRRARALLTITARANLREVLRSHWRESVEIAVRERVRYLEGKILQLKAQIPCAGGDLASGPRRLDPSQNDAS